MKKAEVQRLAKEFATYISDEVLLAEKARLTNDKQWRGEIVAYPIVEHRNGQGSLQQVETEKKGGEE